MRLFVMPLRLAGKAMRPAEMTLTRMAGIALRLVGRALSHAVMALKL